MRALSFDDISLVPRYNNITSRKDVDTSTQFGDLKLDIPIFSANMDTITGPAMAQRIWELGGMGFLHRFCSIEDNVKMFEEIGISSLLSSRTPKATHTVISLGVTEGLDRFHALYEVGARYFCIDIAHGHSKAVGHLIQQIKEFSSDTFVIAGNVCEPVGASYLADKGADAVKVGVGPGSVCTTRMKTGFGVPQFTAIRDCRRVNVFIIADGGIRSPSDAVKSFVAGADAVMIGGMLAGCYETPGEIIDVEPDADGKGYPAKVFRGMASKEAQDEHMGSMSGWKTAEGIEMRVEAKGSIGDVISDLMGGIRSGMCYCGANDLQQLRHRADWVEVTAAGKQEGTAHGQGRL